MAGSCALPAFAGRPPPYGVRSCAVAAPRKGARLWVQRWSGRDGRALLREGGSIVRIFELSTHVKSISRGTGGSATAAAAYRACCAIESEIDGKTHDYTRKTGLEACAIILPKGAPSWAADRAKLWNGAELRERNGARGKNAGQLKRNAALAREFMFSFPVELSEAGRLQGGADDCPAPGRHARHRGRLRHPQARPGGRSAQFPLPHADDHPPPDAQRAGGKGPRMGRHQTAQRAGEGTSALSSRRP